MKLHVYILNFSGISVLNMLIYNHINNSLIIFRRYINNYSHTDVNYTIPICSCNIKQDVYLFTDKDLEMKLTIFSSISDNYMLCL